ncbi:MAG: MBL fold metallo-hydrolase [Acutalibacteraceae bacterium]
MARICPLFSGSSGNSYFVGSADAGILIDIGRSAKQIQEMLSACDIPIGAIKAIFLTHEHTDHIKGLRVFTSKYKIPVFSSQGTLQALEETQQLNADVPAELVDSRGIECAGMWISSFPTLHDCAEGIGFHITTADDRTLSFATDLGCMTEQVYHNLAGSDFVVLESNHDVGMLKTGNYPYILKQRIISDYGYLSTQPRPIFCPNWPKWERLVLLAHLSHENNTPDIALQTSLCSLTMEGLKRGLDYEIDIAPRENTKHGTILF